jgi:hypothetical protein
MYAFLVNEPCQIPSRVQEWCLNTLSLRIGRTRSHTGSRTKTFITRIILL